MAAAKVGHVANLLGFKTCIAQSVFKCNSRNGSITNAKNSTRKWIGQNGGINSKHLKRTRLNPRKASWRRWIRHCAGSLMQAPLVQQVPRSKSGSFGPRVLTVTLTPVTCAGQAWKPESRIRRLKNENKNQPKSGTGFKYLLLMPSKLARKIREKGKQVPSTARESACFFLMVRERLPKNPRQWKNCVIRKQGKSRDLQDQNPLARIRGSTGLSCEGNLGRTWES